MVMTTWTPVTVTTASWTIVNQDYKDRWGDWSALTWGAVASSGFTWAGMAGDTFLDGTSPSTTWTITT